MLSWLPIYNSWIVFIGLVSIFLWNLWGVMMFLAVAVVSVYFLLREVLFPSLTRYPNAFWLFILSEVAAFGSLLVVVAWNDEGTDGSLSDSLELPFLGCFLLLTSSLTATIYHHSFGLPSSVWFLVISIILGLCFIGLQLWEFFDCECDVLYCSYLGAAFCTVGLHFMHVFGGVVAMTVLLVWGASKNHFYASVIVWYWHFVDYVWLWVYLIVYYV
uniref:cytochrome c oxidase subunit III n=1 Tax=Cryptocotyle lingua TaxID=66766 RepID=UPI0020285A74|nr:cytochrome c oxidase subunit III [Cryptocotyle lingua]UQU69043.1 cytochrome c oxidase subunit 3 [Cryptocotyle lingua]